MENTEEIYTDFARVYDELMDNTPYEMWCNRLDQLIASYGVSRPTRDAEGILDSERNLVVDLGCGTGLHPESDHYAVKVPVFSFQKLRDLDTQLGPEMKSTGEVLGVAKSFREALLKGLTGAGFQMKKKGAVLISVRDSDKQEAIRIGERFEALGFDIYATSGTANVLNRHMVATNAIRNVDEPSPNIIDLIESGKIDYVIATSVKGRHPELGSVHIRRTAVERAIPCLTSMDTVSALLRCLEGDIKIENCEMIDINSI